MGRLRDGVLRVHVTGRKAGLFSAQASGLQRHALLDAVLGPLVPSDQGGLDGLLESCEACPDARTWTFRLRPDLTFHNGRACGARDLEFTLRHASAAPFETPEKSLLRNVASVAALDGRAVEVRLREPDPAFAALFRSSTLSLLPREELASSGAGLTGPSPNSGAHLSWERWPVGAGPYRVVRVAQDGAEVEVEAARGLAPEAPARIVFTTGECRPDTDLAVGFSSNPLPERLAKAVVDAPFSMTGLYFDYAHPSARDLRFRQAVASAIDGEKVAALLADVKPAHGIVPSNFLVRLSGPPPARGRCDPGLAARLFKEAAKDVRVRLSAPTTADAAWVGEVGRQLAAAGLPTDVVGPEDGRPSPVSVSGFIPALSDLAQLFSVFREGSGWVSRLDARDAVYEGLLEAARVETDLRRREALLVALSERFSEQAYAVPLFEEPVVFWVDRERVRSVGARWQGIDLVYEKIELRQGR